MKKIVTKGLLIAVFSMLACASKKTVKDFPYMMTKANSEEVAEFLKTIHQEDTRYPILKKRYTELRNKEWVKRDKVGLLSDCPKEIIENKIEEVPEKIVSEEKEFQQLSQQKNKTVNVLNALFDNDQSNKTVVLMVKNNSKCNIILRIKGNTEINLPIASQKENSVVLPKGAYQLRSTICNTEYSTQKTLTKNTFLALKFNAKTGG